MLNNIFAGLRKKKTFVPRIAAAVSQQNDPRRINVFLLRRAIQECSGPLSGGHLLLSPLLSFPGARFRELNPRATSDETDVHPLHAARRAAPLNRHATPGPSVPHN